MPGKAGRDEAEWLPTEVIDTPAGTFLLRRGLSSDIWLAQISKFQGK